MNAVDKAVIAVLGLCLALQDFEDGKAILGAVMLLIVAVNAVACIAILARRF